MRTVSYLSLPAGRVNLDFRGNRSFLRYPALRGVPACPEIRQALEGPGRCCGTRRWGFGSVTCWHESFVLQKQRRKRTVRGRLTVSWKTRVCSESGCWTAPQMFQNGVQGEKFTTYRLLAARKLVWRWSASCSEEQSRPECKEEGCEMNRWRTLKKCIAKATKPVVY